MPYTATLDRNGTEDELTIRAPDGRPLACIQFWGDEDEANREFKDAELIVKALNAYKVEK